MSQLSTEERIGELWESLQNKISQYHEGKVDELWMDIVVLLRDIADLIEEYKIEVELAKGEHTIN